MTDNRAYAAAMRRMITAWGRRLAAGDIEDAAELMAIRDLVDQQLARAVHAAHDQHGRSWRDIGAALGMTGQAAWDRWARRPAREETAA